MIPMAIIAAFVDGPLVPWDEQIYATAARSVLDGHVLIPHFTLENHGLETGPFLEKPPLGIWLQALSMAVLGETAFGARVPSILAFGGVISLTVLLGTKWFSPRAGALAGAALVATNAVRATHAAQHAAMDMMLLFWGTLAVYTTVRGKENGQWLLVAGVSLAAAILTKGIAGLPFGLLIDAVVLGDIRTYLTQTAVAGVALFAVVTASWHVAAYLSYPEIFVEQYFIEQVIERSAGTHGNPIPGGFFGFQNFPYFRRIPTYFDVAFLGAVVGAGYDIYRTAQSWAPSWIVAICYGWALLFPIGYAVAGGDHIWYMMPSVVPLALLAGRVGAVLWTAVGFPEFEQEPAES
jgi:4-amino-4-deoxy-L-arabinose transferase-like glycosyltransferase